jgi:dolichol-phosphate mannosyltransferase
VTAADLDLTIVIPVLNEAPNVPPLLERVRRAAASWPHRTEILFVDDGSTDGSAEAVAAASAGDAAVRVVRHPENRGFGAAVRSGYENARGAVVATMDADLTHEPATVGLMMDRVRAGADLVVGSRYLAGGGMHEDVPAWRRVVSACARVVIGALFRLPVSDPTNGFRAIRRERALSLGLTGTSFDLLPEMVVKAQKAGLRVDEVPMRLGPRVHGVSKLRWSDFVLELGTLL